MECLCKRDLTAASAKVDEENQATQIVFAQKLIETFYNDNFPSNEGIQLTLTPWFIDAQSEE